MIMETYALPQSGSLFAQASLDMQRNRLGRSVEQLLEAVIGEINSPGCAESPMGELAREVHRFQDSKIKVVAFGGGTGLSTVIGGNSQLSEWPDNPFVGLKEHFASLDVVVCTTDDGGSTGLLLQQLPIIAIGDLRKILLSMISRENLRKVHGLSDEEVLQTVRVAHCIFNHRFPTGWKDFRPVADPSLLVPEQLRSFYPPDLSQMLCFLGRSVTPGGTGPTIEPGGHCLGNLLLTAAIFGCMPGGKKEPPGLDEIKKGLDVLGTPMGVTPGLLHPVTPTPGQLVLRYSNGVAVRGQRKAAVTKRNFPIDRVSVEFWENPVVCSDLCRAIVGADLIVFAPGSVYTSIMPILQLPPIVGAIKENKKALKILGANFWIQEGETDISRRSGNRGFYVSELVEAYDRNVPGGATGLFDVVLSANLEHIPGSVLSSYALEGKSPIYLDRARVERFNVLPLEATVYSTQRLSQAQVIHHDPAKFSMAVRALAFFHERFDLKNRPLASSVGCASVSPVRCKSNVDSTPIPASNVSLFTSFQSPLQQEADTECLLCDYLRKVDEVLTAKRFSHGDMLGALRDIAWENRDIRIEHLKFFRGACIIPQSRWGRSEEWDNVLGYYDPEDGFLKLHERLTQKPEKLKENLLIAMGESLLGRYVESRHRAHMSPKKNWGAGFYEIRLRSQDERECFFDDAELRTYLHLCRMVPSPFDSRTFRITLNGDEGFIPPGLLFGLMYAWYLNNAYGEVMEYEMSLLRWDPKKLLPHQIEERRRRQVLIDFFRCAVFRHAG